MITRNSTLPNPHQDSGSGYEGAFAWWWADTETRNWTDDPQ